MATQVQLYNGVIKRVFSSTMNHHYQITHEEGTDFLFITNKNVPDHPVNLFLEMSNGKDWIELVLHYNKKAKAVHRRVFLNLPEPPPVPSMSIPKRNSSK